MSMQDRGMRRPHNALSVAIMMLVLSYSGFARSGTPQPAARTGFETLVDNPTVIELSVTRSDLAPESRLGVLADIHAVYAVPRAAFLTVILDIERYYQFVPHVAESELVQSVSDTEELHRTLLRFGFLFFRANFETIGRVSRSRPDERSEAITFRLEESIDGRVSSMNGFWYLETVFIDGQEYTYVRYRIWTEYANPVTGQAQATRTFGSGQLRDLINAYADRVRAGL